MRILLPLVAILLVLPLFSQPLVVEGNVDVKKNQIKNVSDPTDMRDGVTKAYVDAMSEILLNAGINGVVQDIDGNVYKTIKMGAQVWMAENLKTTRYNDGTTIPKVTDNTAWDNLTTPGYCWYLNDSTLNAKLMGALYNYYTVADTNTRNVCPVGWDVPTDAEWKVLTDFLMNNVYGYEGSGSDIGKSMAATFRWNSSVSAGHVGNDQGTNNSSGFTGLPGGSRYSDGTFYNLGNFGYWWSSMQSSSINAWCRFLYYSNDYVDRFDYDKRLGLSVRCVRE